MMSTFPRLTSGCCWMQFTGTSSTLCAGATPPRPFPPPGVRVHAMSDMDNLTNLLSDTSEHSGLPAVQPQVDSSFRGLVLGIHTFRSGATSKTQLPRSHSDKSLVCRDELSAAWSIFTPLLHAIDDNKHPPLKYTAGAYSGNLRIPIYSTTN